MGWGKFDLMLLQHTNELRVAAHLNTWNWQIPIIDTVPSLDWSRKRRNSAKSKSDRGKSFWESGASAIPPYRF